MKHAVFFALILAFALSAKEKQTNEKANGSAAPKVEPNIAILPAPAVDSKSYVIGPEDVLLVKVWHEPELTGPVSVSPDGTISMQLINEIHAAGITPDQLAKKISQRLEDGLMQHPQVTVQVASVNSKKFFISGEINHPGAFPLAVPTRVMEALVQAGGFRDFAKLSKIYVLRGTTKLPFNYKEVSKGKHAEQNILLENGDTIFVP
jgi:polysaccharide export outer membrane protein